MPGGGKCTCAGPEPLPQGYPELLAATVASIRAVQVTTVRRVNHELVLLYLSLGRPTALGGVIRSGDRRRERHDHDRSSG